MGSLSIIDRLLNNQSVAAFIGAGAAFLLVWFNDIRRERRKVKNIRSEIEMNQSLASAKLESTRRMRDSVRHHNEVIPAPILPFNTVLIRQLTAEVLSRLTLDQRRAVEALCYRMEGTDGILEEAYEMTKGLRELSVQADRIRAAERLVNEYADAIVNLKILVEMCDRYNDGEYKAIVTKQYGRAEYEEP